MEFQTSNKICEVSTILFYILWKYKYWCIQNTFIDVQQRLVAKKKCSILK